MREMRRFRSGAALDTNETHPENFRIASVRPMRDKSRFPGGLVTDSTDAMPRHAAPSEIQAKIDS
jgi:hypothetical protein